jgi:DNA invertase Pin-like site-specific DNA recombinase
MKRAVIYACTDVSGEPYELGTHQLLYEYASQNGYDVILILAEEEYKRRDLLSRWGIRTLIKWVQRDKVDVVITLKPSMLSTDVTDFLALKSLFDKHKVKVEYASPESKNSVAESFAELEITAANKSPSHTKVGKKQKDQLAW